MEEQTKKKSSPMKKIDVHAHTTNRVVKGVVPQSADVEALKREMEKHNIEKTVLLATYFPHKSSGVSNFRLYNWIRDRPEFLLFGSLDFENYLFQGINELKELDDMGVLKGVKVYTSYQEIDLHSDRFADVVSVARRNFLPMMFHCGQSYSTKKKFGRSSVANMVKASDLEFLAEDNPEMNFLASHMSKPFFEDLVKTVKRNPNIYTDVSGLVSSKYDQGQVPAMVEEVKRFLGECGPKRLMFGTDFPVQTHEDSVYFVEEAMKDFSDKDKQDVYYNNARRFLK
ncbi:amidohydrolase [archaeon]|jgi:predicted TIM-barrel fold metal-dependent hydrolase|nr:amidohydrolase [archaeon]MBT3578037.1 amidohydrolase [archaeon]MBT6819990.1 amidohydrolase [archaeon]MBT6956292.1 amidohydrolase [archaeon]MBT7025027.1 amidohydrolase [archaeon]